MTDAPDKITPDTEVGVIHKDRRSLDGIYFRDLHPWARARLEGLGPFDKIAADRLADEVAVLVQRRVIDSRSAASDALLDYRDPPRTPRSDRLQAAEELAEAAKAALAEIDSDEGIVTDDWPVLEALRAALANWKKSQP